MGTPGRNATILVVDDDAPIRTIAKRVLEQRGCEVLVAPDSASAFRVADAHPSAVQLLITDIMMPKGNGITLAKAFLAKWPDTRVLYMSGYDAETIELVPNRGAPGGPFLTKPFTPAELLESVENLLPLDFPVPEPLLYGGSADPVVSPPSTSDAAYRLESPAKCPRCGETVTTLKAVRLLRTQVNFISTLPRRGRVLICSECQVILPAELTNF
ncbi:MAG: response regulator [Vicinamibacterales bacterium]|nr:response regulator [Vicinamibacterales bacterium]